MLKEKDYQEWFDTVKKDHNALLSVPKKFWTSELCLEAVKKDYSALHYLSKEYLNEEICIFAYKQSPSSIRYVQDELKELFARYIHQEERAQ